MLHTIDQTGAVGMRNPEAEALAAFRAFNFERIYLRPEAVAQAERVVELLRCLTDWYVAHPAAIDDRGNEVDVVANAVRHVSGMTDRYALRLAVELLGWDPAKLPQGA